MSKKPKNCPKCQSKKIIPILYGMPTEKAVQDSDAGKLKIGGCCMDEGSPEWFCSSCTHEFGCLFGVDDLDEIDIIQPLNMEFSIGGFFGGRYFIRLENDILEYGESVGHPDNGYIKLSISPSKQKWKNFKKKLDAIDVWSWKNEYNNPNVLDGTQWELEIDYGDQKIKSYGSNLYPGTADLDMDVTPEFKALLHALGLLLGGVKII